MAVFTMALLNPDKLLNAIIWRLISLYYRIPETSSLIYWLL